MNNRNRSRKAGILLLAVSLLTGTFATGVIWSEQRQKQRIGYLEQELTATRDREKDAIIIRRISGQMEEIAGQQKELSDLRRKQAEQQATENYRMKLRVETEWKRAVEAQEEAERAYSMADYQKILAEERQIQAEQAKRMADTLAYLTLGRSLASQAATLYHTGGDTLASLLAYGAWYFTQKYKGDTSMPTIFNALSLISGQPATWQQHTGGIRAIAIKQKGDTLYTFGDYGTVIRWEKNNLNGFHTEISAQNSKWDFRNIYTNNKNTIFALSFNEEIIGISDNRIKTAHINTGSCSQIMQSPENDFWILTNQGMLCRTDGSPALHIDSISTILPLDSILYIGKSNGDLLRVNLSEKKTTYIGCFHPVKITALAHNEHTDEMAIGYADGMIGVYTLKKKLQKLIGHRSAITAMTFCKNRLYSCSYDCTLRSWNTATERPEPLTVLESTEWMLSLAASPEGKWIFAGDAGGTLYRFSVSPEEMATQIHGRLTREFTPEEWNYYIGKNIPYETFKQ